MSSVPRYVTVADIRAEGVTIDDASDDLLTMKICLWEDLFDRSCGLWFGAQGRTLELDGNDSRVLFLNIPIIDVTSLTINEWPRPLDPSAYVVHKAIGPPQDDRRNPKIELRAIRPGLFQGPHLWHHQLQRYGFQRQLRQVVEGTFGYTEYDGSIPTPVKYAIRRIVTREFPLLTDPLSQDLRRGRKVVEEQTDYHQYRLKGSQTRAATAEDLYDDPEVAQIIQMYRAPFRISAPGRGRAF